MWKSRAGREMFRRTSGTLLKGCCSFADSRNNISWRSNTNRQENIITRKPLWKWKSKADRFNEFKHWELWDERDLLTKVQRLNVNKPFGFKGIAHPKMKILLHSCCSKLYSVEHRSVFHRNVLKKTEVQPTLDTIDFQCMDEKTQRLWKKCQKTETEFTTEFTFLDELSI